MALVTQWAAFFGQWYADSKTTEKGWSPKWYATVSAAPCSRRGGTFGKSRGDFLSPVFSRFPAFSHANLPADTHPSQYRFWLTSIVGGSILVSLAARGYYAADLDLANSESQVKKLMAARPPGAIGANPKGCVAELSSPLLRRGEGD